MTRLLTRAGMALALAALVLSGTARLVTANLARTDAPPPPEAAPEADPLPSPDGLRVLMRDLAARDAEIGRREAAIALRERDLAVSREQVEAALLALEEAEAALEARMFASAGAAEADLERLTRIYEGMKPRDAAGLFGAMDPDFAAGFLGRMAPDSAAAILSALDPLAAYAVSARIAGRNAGAASEDRP